MPFQIIRNDITKVKADVIVNTANPNPVIGGGTDSAVYAAAGAEELLSERMKIGEIAPGQAAVTPAFGLQAKYIIHTVGPLWTDGKHGEREILRSCYEKSLALAAELKAKSIAFPLIATGIYEFPKDEALDIALAEIGKYLLTHDMNVILVVFDKKSLQLSKELVRDIDEFIDEYGVDLAKKSEYGKRKNTPDYLDGRRGRWEQLLDMSALSERTESIMESNHLPSEYTDLKDKSLEEMVGDSHETFQERLFKLIDASEYTKDSKFYRAAGVDRKLFSAIRCNKDYKPSRRTAIALGLALKPDLPTMMDLLDRAGFSLSLSSKADLIIIYCVLHGEYDYKKVDAILLEYGQPTLNPGK